MRKIFYAAVSLAVIALASCGDKKTEQTSSLEDSVVAFVQSELKAEMIQELDSLVDEIGKCNSPAFVKTDEPILTLTKEEKQVKPDYLLNPKNAANANVLSEMYRALTALRIDRNIANLYEMDVTEYDNAMSKLLADINDPALAASFDESDMNKSDIKTLYAAEQEAGRINYVWQCIATSNVESLYIMSQNVDKFTSTLDDEAAANITKRLAHVNVSANALVDFDSDFKPVAESLNLLKDLNATTVADLRKQIVEQKSSIEKARLLLVQLFVPNVNAK